MKKFLVIQTAFIGDVIMSTPVFKGLKKIDKNANIDVLIANQYKDILENNPYIGNIIVFNKKHVWNKIFNMIRLILKFRMTKYDLAISIQGSYTSSLLMKLGGIKYRIGARRQKLLTHPVTFPKGLHIRERIGYLLREVENLDFDLDTELFTSEVNKEKVDNLIEGHDHFKLGIAPGSIRETKKWPSTYFIELINKLPDTIDIYLIGGSDDSNLAKEILTKTTHKNINNYTGCLSLLESTELISRMDLMLTNDSAPLHMANAVNTPVFAFFGPTVKRFGCYPYREQDLILEVDLYCRPCGKHGEKKCPEGHFRCMREITPQFVLDNINQFMEANGK